MGKYYKQYQRIEAQKYSDRRTDILIVLGITLLSYVLFSLVDMAEVLTVYFKEHEDIEVDEILPSLCVFCFALVWLSYRRLHEAEFLKDHYMHASNHDHLTGLYNRLIFNNLTTIEAKRFHRRASPFSIVMIDLDDFKQINDTYGHRTGDAILKEFANTLQNITRDTDTAARWGGEEFIVLCRDTHNDGACEGAKHLQQAISEQPLAKKMRLTMSIGIASIDETSNLEQTLHLADLRMYAAKKHGKNRIVSKGALNLLPSQTEAPSQATN